MEDIKNKAIELWGKYKHCVIAAVAGFVLGVIISESSSKKLLSCRMLVSLKIVLTNVLCRN